MRMRTCKLLPQGREQISRKLYKKLVSGCFQINIYIYKPFPPKDLEKILLKNKLRNAHAYVQTSTSRTRANLSQIVKKLVSGCFQINFSFATIPRLLCSCHFGGT